MSEEWLGQQEGQLSVDVIETNDEIVIRSAIAGVAAEDLDIAVTTDTITIRGEREGCETSSDSTVHLEECYWGSFSRSIVLPSAIKPDETDAVIKNGILTVTLKKAEVASNVSVLDMNV